MISSTTKGPSVAAVVRGDEVQVGQSVVGLAVGDSVSLRNTGAVAMSAKGPVTLTNGYCQWVFAGKTVDMRNGGAAAVFTGEGLKAEDAGLAAVFAGKAEVRGGFVGLVVAGEAVLGEGTKVLLGVKEALALGLVLGLVLRAFGLGRRSAKRKRGGRVS